MRKIDNRPCKIERIVTDLAERKRHDKLVTGRYTRHPAFAVRLSLSLVKVIRTNRPASPESYNPNPNSKPTMVYMIVYRVFLESKFYWIQRETIIDENCFSWRNKEGRLLRRKTFKPISICEIFGFKKSWDREYNFRTVNIIILSSTSLINLHWLTSNIQQEDMYINK